MQAINAFSKNPERAMMLMEIMNSNTQGTQYNAFFNTLAYGIRGTHWDLDGNGMRIFLDAADRYNTNTEWMWASNFQGVPPATGEPDVWEQTKIINNTALVSPLCGFLFDASPVNAEVGACAAVIMEYYRGLSIGATSKEEYQVFLDRLDAAGAEIIMAEMQKQVDAWLATR